MSAAPTVVRKIGNTLRESREGRGMSVEELSNLTRIPSRQIELVESGELRQLPGGVFVRGFIRAHARAVGADAAALVESFDQVREAPKGDDLVPAVVLPGFERARRSGLAIALVVLLILFTLALSIVLQPRRRNAPTELSVAPTSALVQRA